MLTVRPNSRFSRIRYWLVRRIEPKPEPGTAWCLNCSLYNGKTIILRRNLASRATVTSAAEAHIQAHFNAASDSDSISIVASTRDS